MSGKDKAKNTKQGVQGKAKEAAGKVTGNRDTELRGKGDQVRSDLKQAGEKVKDSAKH
jgi:uncharacterized protein YjbJ (UPF0337 family)